jgi:rubrerythrin
MIAQRTRTNTVVVTSDDATVQAAVTLLTRNRPVMLLRWECEVCGMVHTGSKPNACESCGKEGSLVHRPDVRYEVNSRC